MPPRSSPRRLPPPQVFSLRDLSRLGDGEFPRGPIAIHFQTGEWEELTRDARSVRTGPAVGAIGLIPIPEPGGGTLIFPQCFTGSADVVCIPVPTRGPVGGVIFGGCRCLRAPQGAPPLPRKASCALRIAPGLITCARVSCSGPCRLVRQRNPLGTGYFFSCECVTS